MFVLHFKCALWEGVLTCNSQIFCISANALDNVKRDRIFMTDFTFHNVGQGLFYSGRIEDFNFIYDCGSESKTHIQSVVSDYKRSKLRNSHVDLLVLSHLHADHVSGLADLLGDGIAVDAVMLPYLSPMERLMVSLDSNNPPEWLRRFWADPISYLVGKGARKIVLFGNSEASPPEDVPIEEYFEDREKMDINKLPNDEKLEEEVRAKERKTVTDLLSQGTLFAKKHHLSLPVKKNWLFRFFNRKPDDLNRNIFEQCIKANLPDNDPIDIIRDRSKLRTLRTCYHKLAGDFNNTSLVLYHAPITNRLFRASQFGFCPCSPFPRISRTSQTPNKLTIHLHNRVGHLLSGDIDFKNNWSEISRHFGHYLSIADLVLVPHHGSKENWNQTALNRIANTCCWVISAGSNNKYGHPDPSVCQDIANSGSSFQCVNEGTEISIRSIIHF